MLKNKISLLALLTLLIFTPVYAIEDTLEESTNISSNIEQVNSHNLESKEVSSEDIEITKTNPDMSWVNTEAGDGFEIITGEGTSPNATCQVTIRAIVPEGFGHSISALIEHIETGQLYQIGLFSSNSYIGYMMFDEGSYRISSITVEGDYKMEYPMTIDSSIFTLTGREGFTYETTLKNYTDVYNKINGISPTPTPEPIVETPIEVKDENLENLENNEVIDGVSNENLPIEQNTTESNSTILYILLGVVFVAFIVVYMKLNKMKENNAEYNIHK